MRNEWIDSLCCGQQSKQRPIYAMTPAKLALACLALCSTHAYSQPYKGTWGPTSTTAVSITGGVTIDSHKIAFAGAGEPMVLDTKIVDARAGRWLFAVTGSKTGAIPLLNDNSLCERGTLPTYVVVQVSRSDLLLGVSSEVQAPSLGWTGIVPPVDCGTYFYSR